MNKKQNISLKKLLPLSLCCITPIALLLLVPIIAKYSSNSAMILSFISPLICPLVMGGMFIFLFKNNKSCCNDKTISKN